MTIKRMIALVGAMAMMLAALALPAAGQSASEEDIGFFVGNAAVAGQFENKTNSTESTCDDTGQGVVDLSTPGLYLPDANNLQGPGIDAVYHLETELTALQNGAGEFEVCGYIEDTAVGGVALGIGAACGWSTGRDGRGLARSGSHDLKIYNIEWEIAPGGTIPVTGRYDVTGGPAVGNSGTILAIVQAMDDQLLQACAGIANGGQGAQGFDVEGVFALVRD